jgi:hypothetical protein
LAQAENTVAFLDEITNVSDFIWAGLWNGEQVLPFPPMVIVLLGVGLWMMVGLRFYPVVKLGAAFAGLFAGRKSQGSGEISPFAALSTALSGQVGTGNLAGVATAITLGGPGAIFWMWITALIGMALAFAEGALAIRYREKTRRHLARRPDELHHDGPWPEMDLAGHRVLPRHAVFRAGHRQLDPGQCHGRRHDRTVRHRGLDRRPDHRRAGVDRHPRRHQVDRQGGRKDRAVHGRGLYRDGGHRHWRWTTRTSPKPSAAFSMAPSIRRRRAAASWARR